MRFKTFFLCTLLLTGSLVHLQAGANQDWAYIVSLDAGPKKKPSSKEETLLIARNHFLIHRKALEQFLLRYPNDPRAFDAKMKLAAILAAEGKMDSDPRKVDEALRILAELEAMPSAPAGKRADAGFHRASLIMQSVRPDKGADLIISTAQRFAQKYPDDRRAPRLLVEAATVCDDKPELKKSLLLQALPGSSDDLALKSRISDDLRRIDLLDKPLQIEMPSLKGADINLEKLRGNVVMIIFWASDAPHSLLWLRDFRANLSAMPANDFKVITINLDTDKAKAQEKLAILGTNWPTGFDGMGWNGQVVRSLGINALPTVWVVDKKGILRTLNAKTDYRSLVQKLAREN